MRWPANSISRRPATTTIIAGRRRAFGRGRSPGSGIAVCTPPEKKKEFGMKSLHQLLLAAVIGPTALASASGPALAQDATQKWKPSLEQVIISAKAPRNYRVVLSNSRLGEAFIVSASMEVPYNDLNLTRDPDA